VKWRLSVNGAMAIVTISVSMLAFSQPSSATSADSTLSQLGGIRIAVERPAGFRQTLFDVHRSQSNSATTIANIVTAREAWKSGAWEWSAAKRKSFVNDTFDRNSVALNVARNAQLRGDRDPASWLPSNSAQTCAYLSAWVSIKARWGLSMDTREFINTRTAFTQQCVSNSRTTSTVANTAASNGNAITTTTGKPIVVGSALAILQTIRVENEFASGYDRSLFEHWRDVDGDGCDSRDQVLKRDSVSLPQVDPISCDVVAGDWVSPYDGGRWSNPADIDIDHVVALKEAWDSGAWAWSAAQRKAYANDTSDSRTLLAVTDSVNQSKSDKDPSNWLPPLQSYTCTYIGNWIAVKARWNLSMDSSEFGRLKNLLQSTCNGLDIAPIPALPSISGGTTVVTNPGATSTASTTTSTGAVATQINPGSYCSPEGAIGYYTLSGSSTPTTYICSKTDANGVPYSGGRARWRRA